MCGNISKNQRIIPAEFGIDAENPFEYYNTTNINEIPKHLREKAKQYLKK